MRAPGVGLADVGRVREVAGEGVELLPRDRPLGVEGHLEVPREELRVRQAVGPPVADGARAVLRQVEGPERYLSARSTHEGRRVKSDHTYLPFSDRCDKFEDNILQLSQTFLHISRNVPLSEHFRDIQTFLKIHSRRITAARHTRKTRK